MREVTVVAPAKVNLSLGVGAVRPDGYHELVTVYQAIGLHDEVVARPAAGFSVEVAGAERRAVSEVPTDESNLAVRAARLLADHHGVDGGVHLTLTKAIPVAGGLAGGSADAAAALVACAELWGTTTPRDELLALAAELGSDVPFALVGGTAIGTGRGEVLAPALVGSEHWWVVLESPAGLSTPEVYREFDRERAGSPPARPPEAVLEALRRGDVTALGAALGNDLQPAALRLRPELAEHLERGLESSALGAVLAGSGPTCLFLADGQAHAREVADHLRGHGLGPLTCAPAPAPGARILR